MQNRVILAAILLCICAALAEDDAFSIATNGQLLLTAMGQALPPALYDLPLYRFKSSLRLH